MDNECKKEHISTLDGIRAIAIILVSIFHFFENARFFFISYFLKIGWISSDKYIVLSALLIVGILLETRGSINFLISISSRIFPLYYLSLILFFVVLLIPGTIHLTPVFNTALYQSIFYYLTFTQNIYFSLNGWGETDILYHCWAWPW